MAPSSPTSLDTHRVSPVRGQLEPYDPRTPAGSRYIQCTETPDELKVLLPPGTAAMYEQLLKLETYELSKKPTISWERLMDVRRLKDRMIRKCQKLTKTVIPTVKKSSRGDTFAFQTYVAPSDFRCKEMEKWFRDQQKRAGTLPRRTITTNGVIEEHTLTVTAPVRRPSTSSKQPIQRSITNPETSSRPKQRSTAPVQKPLPPIIHQPVRPAPFIPPTVSLPPAPAVPQTRMIMSPPPLPVLILAQREELGLEDDGVPPGYNSLDPTTFFEPPLPSEKIYPISSLADPNIPGAQPRPTLGRRPSCIKRNSSEIKSVTWADDDIDGQLSKYAVAAREAQESGKWEEVRALYKDQISGLENLQAQVKEGLEHLRSETDHLQRIDETIRKQREALDASFQSFEQKQNLFQEKVQEALTQATDVLAKHPQPLEAIKEASFSFSSAV
ncbi:hypothetical protein CPB83DRAFT_841730 [Crepidotus variabilis]|uniref:Uncharacterized protein n=1 Tax=Crepidotus variabilis TaxID=179855 RepID=A0A9P6EUD8_9AGAR|nr:hypothetical protein CPB83DRAFT_841730 [Crepidotus variabilis]